MRSYLVLLSLASGALAGVFQRAGCDADNCARAVTGTRYDLTVQAEHTADCSSFMIQTITPATPTTTVTITGTLFSVVGATPSKRSVEGEKYVLAGRDSSADFMLSPPTTTAAVAVRQVTPALGVSMGWGLVLFSRMGVTESEMSLEGRLGG